MVRSKNSHTIHVYIQNNTCRPTCRSLCILSFFTLRFSLLERLQELCTGVSALGRPGDRQGDRQGDDDETSTRHAEARCGGEGSNCTVGNSDSYSCKPVVIVYQT